MNWDLVRAEFPALKRWTYLNTATFGQMPDRSKAAIDRHFDRRNELACSDFLSWFDDMDALRQSLGKFVNCEASDICFVPNASTALSLLLGSLPWREGDRILTLEGEFPNQLYYPAHLAAKGVSLDIAPAGELLSRVTPETRIVAISTVSYSSGYAAPLAEIGRALRSRGILFYLDGTQSLGALRIDLADVQPDLFAVNAYKWMLSPNGAGFAYVAPALRNRLAPAVIGWRSDADWRSVDALNHGAPRFSGAAEQYEGGMVNFSALYAMAETVAFMQEIGPGEIEQRVLWLGDQVRDTLRAAGASILYEGSPIVAARFEDRDAVAIAAHLKQHGILAAARHGNLRVSPHFYNNEEDLGRFADVIGRLR